ncbi:rod shape-determining protein MreD [Vagococcus sp. BWB3-3]|uniref:Rod shape-determining protein MreD n=1 Tax=Vagococcus allomyrinae TaxID=2794353 RepID=A0A940P792_9ENTE|nr:rod shape-determining protein MreD [Vagococcus allomyrinae]MBP1042964.1 rod shape-determining protein MreD [Vagococcus allomyrinae]
MEKKTIMKIVLPFILIILMLLDGQISNLLRVATTDNIYLNSHLLLIGLILGCLNLNKQYIVIMSVILGVIFDVYYYSIIGINMVSLPLTVMLIYVVFDFVRPSVLSILLSLVIFITIMDSSAYFIQAIFKLINGDLLGFITRNLGPTLILNIFLFIILSYPIKKIAKL